MLGWYDLSTINLSLDTFKRRGWLEATFEHEMSHWILNKASAYGIAQHTVFNLRAASVAVGDHELVGGFEDLARAMSLQNGRTQEGVATTSGLEYALGTGRRDLYQDLLDSLTDFYKDAHRTVAEGLKLLGVPEGRGSRIADYLGMLAHGSDILEDWGRPALNSEYLHSSLARHSPDLRLAALIPLLRGLPSGIAAEWEQSYTAGVRPRVPHAIQEALPCRLVDEQDAVALAHTLAGSLASAFWGDSARLRSNVSLSGFVRVARAGIDDAAKTSSNPYWIASVNPARFGNVDRYPDVPPPKIWQTAELVVVESNGLPHPLPGGISQYPLEGGSIAPGSVQVSLYGQGGVISRFVTADRIAVTNQLSSLTDEQYLFMKASFSLPSLRHELFEEANSRHLIGKDDYPAVPDLLRRLCHDNPFPTQGLVPPGTRCFILHVGTFSELLRLLSPFLDSTSPLECLLVPSGVAERHSDSNHLRDLDVGAFGYAVFRFPIEHFPLLIWPVAVLVAEHVFSNRARMRNAGIRIIDDPDCETINVLQSEHDICALECIRRHFERGPN